MSPEQIIKALGGAAIVGKSLGGFTRQRVHAWGRRGIPARFWFDVADIALEAGRTDITIDVLRQSHNKATEAHS